MATINSIDQLDVYQLARKLSRIGWHMYEKLPMKLKIILGDQLIRSVDSVGGNIAEGFGRYHYLDKVKFYYNARGSLLESKHWVGLLLERKLILQNLVEECETIYENLQRGLNGLIRSTMLVRNESVTTVKKLVKSQQ